MNRPRRTSGEEGGAPSSHIASSFTDLMASLMVIFILLFMATLSNTAASRTVVRDTTIEKLLGALKAALEAGGMESGGVRKDDRDPYAVVLVMPEDLLFKRGDASVGIKGQQFLAAMVPVLSSITCSGDLKDKVASVVVEGHTDSVWSSAAANGADGPQLNLELSQRRSMDVVRWSLVALPSGTERDCFRRLLSASGRGQEELLPDISGDDSRQRRVVFKIRTDRDAVDDVAAPLGKAVASGVGER